MAKSLPRAGIYIDGANIYHGGKDAGWKLDYAKLDWFIRRRYSPTIVSYYSATGFERRADGKYKKDAHGDYLPDPATLAFHRKLTGIGMRVVTRPLKFIGGDENKPANKMDGDLMIDATLESGSWDQLILVAGDCDYDKLVGTISSIPKPVLIISYKDRLAHELKMRSLASPHISYTLIDSLRSILEKV
jgi:hypothetical protein